MIVIFFNIFHTCSWFKLKDEIARKVFVYVYNYQYVNTKNNNHGFVNVNVSLILIMFKAIVNQQCCNDNWILKKKKYKKRVNGKKTQNIRVRHDDNLYYKRVTDILISGRNYDWVMVHAQYAVHHDTDQWTVLMSLMFYVLRRERKRKKPRFSRFRTADDKTSATCSSRFRPRPRFTRARSIDVTVGKHAPCLAA